MFEIHMFTVVDNSIKSHVIPCDDHNEVDITVSDLESRGYVKGEYDADDNFNERYYEVKLIEDLQWIADKIELQYGVTVEVTCNDNESSVDVMYEDDKGRINMMTPSSSRYTKNAFNTVGELHILLDKLSQYLNQLADHQRNDANPEPSVAMLGY